MKTVVEKRDVYGKGKHKFHPEMYDLAKRLGFKIKLCNPYRPQTKGKVGTPGQAWLNKEVKFLSSQGVMTQLELSFALNAVTYLVKCKQGEYRPKRK